MQWLNDFDHHREKHRDYSENALAAYALGVKAKGSIIGVVIKPGAQCCEAARELPEGKIYRPDQAPRLPVANCSQENRCDCVYRAAMNYESMAVH